MTIVLRDFNPTDRRLGRKVCHDSQSLRYLAPRKDPRKLTSTRHEFMIPVLDQLNEGSCTGHAGGHNLGSREFWSTAGSKVFKREEEADHLWARQLYCDATVIDNWPGSFEPDDTGSDGLSVAKVLKSRGLIAGYLHATSIEAILTALARQVVMVGTSWYEGMYDVDPHSGRMNVSGPTLGGHEYVLDEIRVESREVGMRNSWSAQWGQAGRAYMSWDDLGKLMSDQGDCTVLVPLTEAPPTPKPEPPPKPVITPEDVGMVKAMQKYLRTSDARAYVRNAAVPWLKTKE